jgi:hypothetical protein
MLTQGLDRHGVQRHQALACRRFRTQLPRRLVLHDAEGPRDPHLRGQQINVSPSQASDLAAAPPSRCEQQPHRIQPIFSNLGEEHAQLRRRPDVMRRLRRHGFSTASATLRDTLPSLTASPSALWMTP